MPPIEASEALRMAAVWDAVGLEAIATSELSGAFKRALQDYTDPSQPFGAAQVRNAANAMQRDRRDLCQPEFPRTVESIECGYCQDSGWQCVVGKGAGGNENTYARPCACSVGLKALRGMLVREWEREHNDKVPKGWEPDPAILSAYRPLTGPDWQRRQRTEIWERVNNQRSSQ
jgi:hypothetical protein